MVNHFRTVLLNISGPVPKADDLVFDQFIPEYQQVSIPDNLLFVEHCLFGDCVTESAKKQKAYQLISLVLSSEVSGAVTEVDSRVTYEQATNFQYPVDTSGLAFTSDLVNSLPDTITRVVLGDDVDIKKLYEDLGTYVDRIAAIVVGYVRRKYEING